MATVDALFEEKWAKEARIEFDAMESKLKGKTTESRDPVKTKNFQLFATEEAKTSKARHADVEITAQEATLVPVTVGLIYQSYMIDDWDAAQVSFNYRQTMAKKASQAVWKKFDDKIITALATSTNSETTLPTANALNFAGAVKMAETLDGQEVPDVDRYGVISPAGMTDLLTDSSYVNNFHFRNEAVRSGVAKEVAGFDLIKFNRLGNGAAGSTERRCYFWQKDAVGTHIAQDFKIKIDWVPMKQGWLFTASMLVGVAIIDHKGVQFCDVTN